MASLEDKLERLRAEISQVEVESAWRMLKSGDASLIDIRDDSEVATGIAEGAIHLPRSFLELKIASQTKSTDDPLLLMCASGIRSLLAADCLKQLGYENVLNVEGGFKSWKEKSLPYYVPEKLSESERERYARHLNIPEIGEEGQRKLKQARVLLIGAGGLGSPASLYLAAAGVGTLGVVDADTVELSNLQRQIVHGEDTLGKPKVESAKLSIQRINSGVNVEVYNEYLSEDNVENVLSGYDLVVDGSDNFKTRYLVNDACTKLKIPNVHGAVYRFDGYVTTFDSRVNSPCYRCFHPEPPPAEMAPSCVDGGVLGAVPGVVGVLQAIEAIKLIVGVGQSLVGKVLTVDLLTNTFSTLELFKESECMCSGDVSSIEIKSIQDVTCAI